MLVCITSAHLRWQNTKYGFTEIKRTNSAYGTSNKYKIYTYSRGSKPPIQINQEGRQARANCSYLTLWSWLLVYQHAVSNLVLNTCPPFTTFSLHELRLLLKHERQELEHVVATKTQAIQQQEQSIEQLASELDQLRRAPLTQPSSRGRHSNGRNWPSGTVSPSSSCSLSSECHVPNQSDFACPASDAYSGSLLDTGPFSSDSVRNHPSAFGVPPTVDHGSSGKHGPQHFRAKAWSERTEATVIPSKKGKIADPVSRFGPNLLDLTRASEGTGIPLGDLIVSKQSLPVRRRFSESKL